MTRHDPTTMSGPHQPPHDLSTLRVRLWSMRNPYGQRLWAWDLYNPAAPANHQTLISGGLFTTWTAARNEGLARRRYCITRETR